MDFATYKEKVKRTRAHLGSKQLDNIHMTMGLSCETGELLDIFKGELAYGKPIDWVHVEEELGDLMWFFVNFCIINDLNIDRILDKNIGKLYARYPENFSAENAIIRNLDNERTVLEQ